MALSRRNALLMGGATLCSLAGAHRSRAQQATAADAVASAPSAQAPGYYRYRVGDIDITAVTDGYADRPIEGYVKNVGLQEVSETMAALHQPAGLVRVPYTTLVLRTGGKTVLIDAGNGDLGAPTTRNWHANFKAAGFDPESVDIVIVSHFHGDHINGLRLRDGTTVFVKAQIMVPAQEWDFWMDDGKAASAPAAMRPAFEGVRRVFAPMNGNVTRYGADQEVVRGVTAIAAYGHTPGHMVFSITSGTARFMCMSDVTNHTSVFLRNPDWHVTYDMDPEQAAKTRHRMAELALSERMQVSFYHAPFPATGFIERAGNGFRLEPVQWS